MAAFRTSGAGKWTKEPSCLARQIWEHYLRSGFVYPEKMRRLESFQDKVLPDLERLIERPASDYQIHYATDLGDGRVVASVSGFRESGDLFAIQHATSEGRPDLLIQCLLALTARVTRSGALTSCMYFTPGNRWPERLASELSRNHSDNNSSISEFHYTFAASGPIPVSGPSIRPPQNESETSDLRYLLSESCGHLRSEALLDAGSAYGTQEILAIVRGQKIVGCGLLRVRDEIVNLSHLCSRFEIHMRAGEALESEELDRLAALASERSGKSHLAILLGDRGASPFNAQTPGKAYRVFTWRGDPVAGFAKTTSALAAWYSRIMDRRQERPLQAAK